MLHWDYLVIQLQQDELLNDQEFLEFLQIEVLKKKYQIGLDEIDKKIKEEFENKDAHTGQYKKRDDEIRNDKKHRNVVNACIYPFSHKGLMAELGYYFIRTEPLLEKDQSDVDFVIESPKKGVAIFGEAKTSTIDSHDLVTEMRKRKDMVEENLQYLQESLIPNSKTFEYVFGTHAIEARDLYASVVKSGQNLMVWMYGGIEDDANVLSIYVPPDVSTETRKRVMHEDNELNRKLVRVPTSTKYKLFFPKSHPIAKLQILTWIDKDIEGDEAETKETFSLKDVMKVFEVELEHFTPDFIERIARWVLDYAVKIGFIVQIDAENYKISISSCDPEARFQDLKEKWIEYSINREKDKKKTDMKLSLQNKLRQDKSENYKGLQPFFK